MRVLERSIEAAVIRYAKKKGLPNESIVKLNGMGRRSHPDRMFLGPKGRVLFIEFKREGEQPTQLQAHLHKKWKKLGHIVHVVDNPRRGKKLIDDLVHGYDTGRIDLMHPLKDEI